MEDLAGGRSRRGGSVEASGIWAPPTCAPGLVGVLPVEDGAVLFGVGDVVAHAGQPLERVEGLEVTPQGRVHAGAVEEGLLAVEVDELAERERVSHEVGGRPARSGAPSLSKAAVPLGESCEEGPAVSRTRKHVAWTAPRQGEMYEADLVRLGFAAAGESCPISSR